MTPPLPESEVFVLLANSTRRHLVRILQDAPTAVSVPELAEQIATNMEDADSHDVVKTITSSLYHNHLPRLDDADVVDYNEEAGTVRPGVNFDTLLRTLETVGNTDLPWTEE